MRQIPNWFIKMRQRVWEDLSKHIGENVNEQTCREVADATNKLLKEFEKSGHPVTHNGKVIDRILIYYNEKSEQPSVQIFHR